MSEIEELKKKISYLENENIVMYAALFEASNLGGGSALRCKVELQRIAREDNAQQSVRRTACADCDDERVTEDSYLACARFGSVRRRFASL